MANVNDIINQSQQAAANMQSANSTLQNMLNQSNNTNVTGSSNLPSNMVLSPTEMSLYQTLMTEDPTTSKHSHGKTISTYLSPKVPSQMAQMTDPNNYSQFTNLLQQDYNQAMPALNRYITQQQQLAPQLFGNTWEAPSSGTDFSTSYSLAGNQPQNKIMGQYQESYNNQQNQLNQQQQQFLTNLSSSQQTMQNAINQLQSPDTAHALIMGATATYMQNVLNRISPYLTSDAYNQSVQNLQSVYSQDQQFANSYNKLFQNYLGLNINLIDQMQSLQTPTIQNYTQNIDYWSYHPFANYNGQQSTDQIMQQLLTPGALNPYSNLNQFIRDYNSYHNYNVGG